MDMLQVQKDRIVDTQGHSIQLRGVNIGGWMNMENFIDGYPGIESSLRSVMSGVLGEGKATFFFDRLLDYFFSEDDVRFIKNTGMNMVRLPLNYRHFESDEQPFTYIEHGFDRLGKAIDWCAKYGVYAVLDLHAVQGYQNSDWHCDNASRHSFFWHNRQFQDRFVALWEEFARRFKGNPAVAGYNVMNEPLVNKPLGRFDDNYQTDFPVINQVYRRVVESIRAIDPNHIIFLDGDMFSTRFAGFEPPFAPNLVYASHNYSTSTFGPGSYPGMISGEYWDRNKQVKVFESTEGTQFTRRHQVPLWVGEFGPVFSGLQEEISDRLRAFDDQLDVLDENHASWSLWTYKDVGVMGVVYVDPDSEYLKVTQSSQHVKLALRLDHWMGWLPPTPALEQINRLSDLVDESIHEQGFGLTTHRGYLAQHTLNNYIALMVQPLYASQFKGMSEERLDEVLSSFSLKKCCQRQGSIGVMKKHLNS